jgi:hypothetical protein
MEGRTILAIFLFFILISAIVLLVLNFTNPGLLTGTATTGTAVVSAPIGVLYGGNNGTVSGDTYCKGAWGSADGKTDKNLKCIKHDDANTGAVLDCAKSYAVAKPNVVQGVHQPDGLRPTNVWCGGVI